MDGYGYGMWKEYNNVMDVGVEMDMDGLDIFIWMV